MLRIAVAQTPGNRLDQWPQAIELVESMIGEAASAGADLVLFPESVWPSYFIGSVGAYLAARRDGMPSDAWFVSRLATWARERRISVCAGCIAEDGRTLRNRAVLVDQTGRVRGSHDKLFLWDFDQEFFAPGESLAPVPHDVCPVGLMICADARLPEIPATLAARGAQLILQPTAWVNLGTERDPWNPQPEFMIAERAREFGVPIASASKWGIEGTTPLVGGSLICDARGKVLAQCNPAETALIVADVDLVAPPRPRMSNAARQRLLSPDAALTPNANVPQLSVAFVECVDGAEVVATADSDVFEGDPAILICIAQSGATVAQSGPIQRGNVTIFNRADGRVHDVGEFRIGCLHADDLAGFAPLRAMAMDGIHMAIVFGELVSPFTVRTRAAENRVFIAHASRQELVIYDPLGKPAAMLPCFAARSAKEGTNPKTAQIQLSEAAEKCFASRTNPFEQRRPELFSF